MQCSFRKSEKQLEDLQHYYNKGKLYIQSVWSYNNESTKFNVY